MLKLIIWEIACILLYLKNHKKHIYQKKCNLIFFSPFSGFSEGLAQYKCMFG